MLVKRKMHGKLKLSVNRKKENTVKGVRRKLKC